MATEIYREVIEVLPKFLKGRRFGRLLPIISVGRSKHGARIVLCRCDCGKPAAILADSLISGRTRSCHCLQNEHRVQAGINNATHGMTDSPEFRAYANAKNRCINKNHRAFKYYGARGIEFRFNSFEEFYRELGPKPHPSYSLDRIDNNSHYERGNVRWATAKDQANNRRSSLKYRHRITDSGK